MVYWIDWLWSASFIAAFAPCLHDRIRRFSHFQCCEVFKSILVLAGCELCIYFVIMRFEVFMVMKVHAVVFWLHLCGLFIETGSI